MQMRKKKLEKIRELISTGKYDADIAKYIPGILEMKCLKILIQGKR